jgi:predicted amidophosphoribosyltransferase
MPFRFSSIKEELLDLLYPSCCLGCGALGACLCGGCLAALAAHAGSREQIPVPPGESVPALNGVRAAGTYEGVIRDMVLRLKSSARPVASPLCSLMAAAAGNDPDYLAADLVCFVPSERAKVAARGYNPAEVLADGLAALTGRPVCHLLEKTRSTKDQDSVRGGRRWRNVDGAFRLRRGGAYGARVLLVDDVLTTGATAHNCARALRAGGAGSVHVLVAAAASLRRSPVTEDAYAK